MQVWKFLLKGVTGDLAKNKILPALAQFAELNEDKVVIDLIGYSRSKPDEAEISNILNSNTSDNQHKFKSISFLQGEYNDPSTFFGILADLKENERLVTYLAIPPHLFIDILKNSCPFSNREIDILIEKPFGRDKSEAENILNIINACDLSSNIFFTDHYLFKTPAHLSKTEIQNFKPLKEKEIQQVKVKALERVDVKNRGGYYDTIGAFKDIFIHLFSLMDLIFDLQFQANFEDYSNFQVNNVELGQYQGYREDIGNSDSKTDSYFQVSGYLPFLDLGKSVEVVLESGKKLSQKVTQLNMKFKDGSKLEWKITPDPAINFYNPEQELEISLNLNKNKKQDHTNLFEDLLTRDRTRFVSQKNVLTSWEMYDQICEFITQNKVQPKTYKPFVYPVEYLKEESEK